MLSNQHRSEGRRCICMQALDESRSLLNVAGRTHSTTRSCECSLTSAALRVCDLFMRMCTRAQPSPSSRQECAMLQIHVSVSLYSCSELTVIQCFVRTKNLSHCVGSNASILASHPIEERCFAAPWDVSKWSVCSLTYLLAAESNEGQRQSMHADM